MSPTKNIASYLYHMITFTCNIFVGPDGTGLQIVNHVDIRQVNNVELGMRFSTNINSGNEFFTDLNGFQMMKRKRRLDKLPIGANYYPIPSIAYIQDEKSRLTLVTKQPLGGSSLKPGQLEIMMDRRLSQDDNRGLFAHLLVDQSTNWSTNCSFGFLILVNIMNILVDELINQMTNK